ncbi:copper resistance D family protein [Arthrobacter roseus]|uniref:copper resistance D family protein n=1 Tax=Arthrobacter roseus TaxID=136274 RepID=UPI0019647B8B|nr:CopD family protein [Arthrobacter roseus]MBM7846952.1 putative copper resistance protein D [Arthrobacter roseus]
MQSSRESAAVSTQHRQHSPWLAVVSLAVLIAAAVPVTVLLVSDDGSTGNLIEWTLPLVRVLVHLTTLATIALLSVAALLPARDDNLEALTLAARRLVVHGSAAAWIAVLACILLLLWTYFNVLGTGPFEGADLSHFGEFLSVLASGRALIAQIGLLLASALLAAVAQSTIPLRMALFLAVAATTTLALGGHSGFQGGHDIAMFSLAAHLAAASLWVGGLTGLGWLAKRTPDLLRPAVARFSRWALIYAVVVGTSGVINALVRVESLPLLFSSLYGLVLLLKVVAFTGLVVFGALHRRRLLRLATFTTKSFLQLAAGELLVMGAAYGFAIALVSLDPPTAAALSIIG